MAAAEHKPEAKQEIKPEPKEVEETSEPPLKYKVSQTFSNTYS